MGPLPIPSRKPEGLERPSTVCAVSRLRLARGGWLRARHEAGSDACAPLPIPLLLCCVSAWCTVVGADRAHPDGPLPLWLGGRNRRPRCLGGALASPALLWCETPVLGESVCLFSQPSLATLGNSLHFLSQPPIVITPRVVPRTLFGSVVEGEVFGSAGGTHKVRTWSRGLDCGLLHPAPWPPSRWLVAHPLSPRPLFGRRKRVPMSRGPSAVQAGSVANGSPARLRACRACSWRPRRPCLYGFGFGLYQWRALGSDPPSRRHPTPIATPYLVLQPPECEGHGCCPARVRVSRMCVPRYSHAI